MESTKVKFAEVVSIVSNMVQCEQLFETVLYEKVAARKAIDSHYLI